MSRTDDLVRRLGDSGLDLLARMVELHLNRRPGSRAEFIWIKSDSMASDHTSLSFTGGTQRRSVDVEHDPVDFQEMIDTRIVARGHGRNAYRLTSKGIDLHRRRLTLPIIHAMDQFGDQHPMVQYLRGADAEPDQINQWVEDIRRSNAFSRAYEEARNTALQAVEFLQPYPAGPYRQALHDIAMHVVNRGYQVNA